MIFNCNFVSSIKNDIRYSRGSGGQYQIVLNTPKLEKKFEKPKLEKNNEELGKQNKII